MNRKVAVGLSIAVILAAGGVFAFMRQHGTPSVNSGGNQPASATTDTTPALQPSTDTTAKEPAVTITYTDAGFSPAHVTVKSGDVVRMVNNSSHAAQFSSDPHPVHTKDTDLNQQTVAPGGSQTFVVTKKGTYGFHDHLDATKTGTITIE